MCIRDRHNAQKQHVAVTAHPQKQPGQAQVEQIEKGQHVAPQDIGHPAFGPAGHGVGSALFPAGAHLLLRKSVQGDIIGMHAVYSLAAQRRGR